MRLQVRAHRYGVEFNEHYLRNNADGSVTVTVFGTRRDIRRLRRAGYDVGRTIEGQATWRKRIREYMKARRAEKRARRAALKKSVTTASHEDEVVILRVDYFENYAGRFLSVEAKDRLGGAAPTGSTYVGPTLSLSWDTGPGTPASPPRAMAVNIDPDTTPDTYIEHRLLVRIGEVGTTTPPRPARVRVGSSTGAVAEADVNTWLGGGLPPMGSSFLKDFTTHYMDPTEVYQRIAELADEFPNIARLVRLPNRTNGYQRRAQALMAGTIDPGELDEDVVEDADAEDRAVVLTSREWGHEGGNMIAAEFRTPTPSTANSPLSVRVVGRAIIVTLGTDAAGAPSSTAADVVEAINGDPEASRLVVAGTYRGSEGGGIVERRTRVNLSDFLSTATNAHVRRGPFRYSVLRIGRRGGGEKVGVFLYCQQHAREWATPLTCLETAEQLLRNYAIHPQTRRLVDNLDIFILPSSNPDGSHYSMHNFNFQRRNMTNFCVVGGQETDNPNAPNFWEPRINPGTNAPYTDTDPVARDEWGVDLNRNNTVGTIFDGYIGASHSCTSDVYTGPAEASEPEIRNELWIADTFDNIKFSNNIHSFGGYFMWAPGAYLPDRSEGDLVHANIGVEKYFFAAGDRILNRIKEVRNTAILPERTGPIADVLYSAGGNSADEHWYKRDVIAYSFETGADRYFSTLSATAPAGAPGIRLGTGNLVYLRPGDTLTVGAGGPNPETRTVASIVQPNPSSPNPNVLFTEPLQFTHTANPPTPTRVEGAALQTGVGFQPDYATEGKFEALEFAAGNFGLLESALDYALDVQPPQVQMTGPFQAGTRIDTTFQYINEPSVIWYTTDGSRPTRQSTMWDSTGPREPGQVFHLTESTTFRWLAEDIKGNTSRGSETFVITGGG
jgi:Zinc carboxypeptidase/Chitobiase/beta-hexosaminidase C-terminal domain